MNKKNIYLMYAIAFFQGIVLYATISTLVIYLSSEKDKTQKTFGWYASFGTAGMLTGCAVFTLFLSNDFSGCAFGTMISYGIAFLLTLFIDEVKGKAEGDERITVSNLLNTIKISIKDVKFLGFLLAAALLGNASWLISVMLYQDKYLLLGINEQQMGIITIGISIAGLFSFASDFFTKKLGKCKFLSLLLFAIF